MNYEIKNDLTSDIIYHLFSFCSTYNMNQLNVIIIPHVDLLIYVMIYVLLCGMPLPLLMSMCKTEI